MKGYPRISSAQAGCQSTVSAGQAGEVREMACLAEKARAGAVTNRYEDCSLCNMSDRDLDGEMLPGSMNGEATRKFCDTSEGWEKPGCNFSILAFPSPSVQPFRTAIILLGTGYRGLLGHPHAIPAFPEYGGSYRRSWPSAGFRGRPRWTSACVGFPSRVLPILQGSLTMRVKHVFTSGYLYAFSISLLGLCSCNPAEPALDYVNPRVYNVDFTFELKPGPDSIDRATDLKLWLPVPREWDSQREVRILSVDPPPHGEYTDPEFGNPMFFWDFGTMPEQPVYSVNLRYRLEALDLRADIDPSRVGAYDTTERFLLSLYPQH
jgi:hypothetical protein